MTAKRKEEWRIFVGLGQSNHIGAAGYECSGTSKEDTERTAARIRDKFLKSPKEAASEVGRTVMTITVYPPGGREYVFFNG